MTTAPSTTTAGRANTMQRAQVALAGVMALLILVMALIAGRSMFDTWDIEVHGWIGNTVFVLAVANLTLAIARRASTAELTIASLIGMLTFAQVGLGYVGREEAEAAAWHIPNGVLLMALSTYQYAELRRS